MRRWALVGMLAILGVVDVSAQSAVPGRVFVRDSSGGVWYVNVTGQRSPVAIYPATDEEIAAFPDSGLWFANRPSGNAYAFTIGPKPDYTTGTIAPVAAEEPVKLDGERAQNTRPFDLRGGTYRVEWEAKLPKAEERSCRGTMVLHRTEGRRMVDILYSVMLRRDGDRSASGETMLYSVASGQHYLDAIGECEWRVTISPG